MGIFGLDGINNNDFILEQELKNPNEFLEAMIYDEVVRLPDERRKEFCNSQEAQAMMEAGLISRKTLVRLSKKDDLERRIGMAAIQMAKDSNDILYDQLIKTRIKERELLDKINTKYVSKATRLATVGQRDFLKQKLPITFFRK